VIEDVRHETRQRERIATDNRRGLRYVLWLSVTLVPGFGILDLLVAPPDRLVPLLAIRGVLTALAVGLLVANRLESLERHSTVMSASWSVVLGWTIGAICLLEGGYETMYYPGVMLVMLGVALMFTWKLALAIIVQGLIAIGFLLPQALMRGDGPVEPGVLAIFFLVSMAVISIAGHTFRFRATSREVTDRLELEELRRRAEALAESLKARTTELERLASFDTLTGLANRRVFDEMFRERWAWLARERSPMALLVVDIDHFKAYNDTLGHQAGDRCLQRVADALREAVLRPTDLVARVGGEEFVLLLTTTALDGGEVVARRVLDAVRDAAIHHPSSPVAGRVTVSVGVASTIPEATTEPSSLVEAADQAMYQAKQAGRNRIAIGE